MKLLIQLIINQIYIDNTGYAICVSTGEELLGLDHS